MPIFDVQKYKSMQSDEMLKIYTSEMYDIEWEKTESLEKELFDLLYDKNEIAFDRFVNETEPLATYDYFFGMFTEYFIEDIPIIPVRTIKRVREQIISKLNSLN